MPCNSDHLAPNLTELESQRAASLIVYVNMKLSRSTEPWIQEIADNYYGARRELNKLTVMLCALCTEMSDELKNVIIYNAREMWSRRLADWWEAHQAADKKRILAEQQEAENLKLRESALDKLTEEEKKALGLN